MIKFPISKVVQATISCGTRRAYAVVAKGPTTLQDFFDATIKPILAPVSTVTDIQGNTIKPCAALRMGMHHLHATQSRFLPKGENYKGVFMHCVSQVCQTYPIDNLQERLLHKKEYLQMGELEIGVTPLLSETWVQSLGRTSITFGQAVSLENELLALVTRIFVRQARDGTLVHITDDERTDQFPASYEEVDLPIAERLHHPEVADMKPIFDVLIGPQHCNEQYCDPPALAEIALQGLSIKDIRPHCQKVSFQHMKPALLNQKLSCRMHKNRPLIGLYRDCNSGNSELIVLATIGTN